MEKQSGRLCGGWLARSAGLEPACDTISSFSFLPFRKRLAYERANQSYLYTILFHCNKIILSEVIHISIIPSDCESWKNGLAIP